MPPLGRFRLSFLLASLKSACVVLAVGVAHGHILAHCRRLLSQRVVVAQRCRMSTVLWLSPATHTPLWLALEASGQQTAGTPRLTARALSQTVGSQGLTEGLAGPLALALAGLEALEARQTKGILRRTARPCTVVAVVAGPVGIVALVVRAAITKATAQQRLARQEPQERVVLLAAVVVALAFLIQPQTIKSMQPLLAGMAVALALRALGLAEPVQLVPFITGAQPSKARAVQVAVMVGFLLLM